MTITLLSIWANTWEDGKVIKDHTALVNGDRIVEGTGKHRKVIKVQNLSRYPENLCIYGTHIDGPDGWQLCYTGPVRVR